MFVRRIVICPFGPFAIDNSQGTLPPADGSVNQVLPGRVEGLLVGQLQLARDLDAALDRTGDGTRVRVDLEYALNRVPILRVGGQVEVLPDPLHDQYFALRLYLPYRVGVEVLEGNSTRCQRAPEGAEQSAARCGHQIIEGGVVGFDLFRAGSVVLGDLAVDAEEDRLFLDG
jgi:hypothetical protein